jgi:mannan endo-1,4-beta-mannosidase
MRAWTLVLMLAAAAGLPAAPAWVTADGAGFSAGGAPLALRGEDAADAADALRRLGTARSRGVNLIHLRLDSLPGSSTPGVPSAAGWAALDQVLAQAGVQGVYLLPSLASFRSGGGAERLAKGLGGSSEGLYLADGRAREWYLYVLQTALRRPGWRDNPALLGWSLAADLGDPDDPEGARAVNWALRAAALIRREDPRHLIGLHYALPAPARLAQVQALDFLVVPAAASATAQADLARPLLFAGPAGIWTGSAASGALSLSNVSVRLLDSHTAEVTAQASARARLRVDYGLDGLQDRRQLSPMGERFRVSLAGLRGGKAYSLRVSASDGRGGIALARPLRLDVPGETALPPVRAPYSGRIITARDGHFWDGERRYRYVGTNNYYIRYIEDEAAIAQVLDAARDMGMGVIRAQANGERFEPMQPGLFEPMRHLVAGGPDGFQEAAFRRYDQVMAEAGKRGLRVIVYIADNWEYFGGLKTWVRWRGLDDKNKFYTDERVKADYKRLIKQWATRVNTVTGVAYKDDPVLFAWELANETRNEADTSSKTLAAWTQEMAAYWKTLDSKHMVATGLEGPRAHGGTHHSGADFEIVQSVPAIDFACFHLYPVKTHLRYSLRAVKASIRDYVRTAHQKLKKPVVMEEFGVEKKYEGELSRFEWVSTMMKAFVDAGGDGFNHWMLVHDGYQGTDGFEIAPADTEYVNLIKRLSVQVNGGRP